MQPPQRDLLREPSGHVIEALARDAQLRLGLDWALWLQQNITAHWNCPCLVTFMIFCPAGRNICHNNDTHFQGAIKST